MKSSSHVRLSRIEAADVAVIARLYTDGRVREFLGGPVDVAAAKARVEALFLRPENRPAWAIRSVDDGHAVGLVMLDDHHDGEDVEISYLVLPEHQRKGHGAWAVREGVRFASEHLGIRRIVAETQTANFASVRLLERVGMVLERRVFRFGAWQSVYVNLPGLTHCDR